MRDVMKDVVFIGNRLNALQGLVRFRELNLVKAYVLEGSLLHRSLEKMSFPPGTVVDVFGMHEKTRLIDEIDASAFDILLSNGCPFILPVDRLKKPHQIFINIHPTLLPHLKGKTPLNGVFFTGSRAIGATMHHMDEGVDTGRVIAQEKVKLTKDIDQGLVYFLSFALERVALCRGMERLIESNFRYKGRSQAGEGSYFNRTSDLQKADAARDDAGTILKTVKSFGIKSQGTILSAGVNTFLVFAAEEIVNPYLLSCYEERAPGETVLEYDGKTILRVRGGLIKLIDFVVRDSAASTDG